MQLQISSGESYVCWVLVYNQVLSFCTHFRRFAEVVFRSRAVKSSIFDNFFCHAFLPLSNFPCRELHAEFLIIITPSLKLTRVVRFTILFVLTGKSGINVLALHGVLNNLVDTSPLYRISFHQYTSHLHLIYCPQIWRELPMILYCCNYQGRFRD